jgi:hypothetical protein
MLEMGLLPCCPAQFSVVPQMGELCGVFLEIAASRVRPTHYS